MGRLIARLIAAQDGWARPLGDFNHRWLSALFRPIRPVKDFLNGVWLGHPLHAAATDIPIGSLLVTVVLDLMGQSAAADVALVATILFMLPPPGPARPTTRTPTGRPPPGDAPLVPDGRRARPAHRLARAPRRGPRRPDDPCRAVGHRVPDRDRGGVRRWRRRVHVRQHGQPARLPGRRHEVDQARTGDVTDLATLPEATPTKARAGTNDLVLVRIADTVYAFHAVCAHAGGPSRKARSSTAASNVRGTARNSGCATATSGAGRRSTTSPPTRSARPMAAATRSGARSSVRDTMSRSSSPTRAWSSSSGPPGPGSRRSRRDSSARTRSSHRTASGRSCRATRPTRPRRRPPSGLHRSWRGAWRRAS